MSKQAVYVRLPTELLKLVELDCRHRGLSRSEMIRKIIQDYYEDKSVFTSQLKQDLGLTEVE